MITADKTIMFEAENAKLKQEISMLSAQVKQLTEQLLLMRQQQFGRSSEKKMSVIANQLTLVSETLFNEAEFESSPSTPEPELEDITYKRKKQKGKREVDFAGLPVEQIIHKLPEADCICPDCGNSLHACGHDMLRRELTVIPAQYKVTEHIQTVYSCRDCERNAEQTPMLKAPVPAPVIRGSGIASPSLVAHIANQKYSMALPLYRQEQELKRNKINLSRQTMANWLIYAAIHWLAPIYSILKHNLLMASVLHADETSVQVLRENGKPAESKSYMWLYRTGCDAKQPIVLYDYKPNRKHENAKAFLSGFSGYLHADGYQAYDNLPPEIINVGCWAHVRRKFADILKSLPDYNRRDSLAARGTVFCDKLFALEREYDSLPTDNDFKARYEARQEQSKPLMGEFFAWAHSVNGSITATPRSSMGKALAYALNQRSQLENVLCDGRLELSNNRAERSIKPFVIGRKNWLFSNTENGANASAMFYSIIETAKENCLKPYDYLLFVFETAPYLGLNNNPDAVQRLLPWDAPDSCRE